jgi:carboxymethylenebutenolidase
VAVWDFWRTIWGIPGLAGVVFFGHRITPASHSDQLTSEAPLMVHSVRSMLGGNNRMNDITHVYESAASSNFSLPEHEHYQAGPANVAHTRSLGFLKKHLNGPYFDLEVIWDEHTLYEFGERNVEKTMATMVAEPYVNHVPTVSSSFPKPPTTDPFYINMYSYNSAHQMTGGIGRVDLTAFYRDHFIFNNPPDTELELVSRTVGTDRIIDEFIFSFTHTKVIDWL